MNAAVPASTAPIGAPRPFVKSIQTESAIAANTLAATPVAALALSRRAPSI
jgi:hypothetical protein